MFGRQWSLNLELLNRSRLRSKMGYVGAMVVGGVLLAVLAAARSADAGPLGIDPLASPPTPPPARRLVVSVNCTAGWNPTCRPKAVSTAGLRVTSTFFIDGRAIGPANRTYTNVCARYGLRDGYHTARVTARDSRGNTASTGNLRVIRCDRTKPAATPGVKGISAYPKGSDAMSGVKSRGFYVDHYRRAWRNYANLCTTFRLRAGRHVASVEVIDRAGNSRITRQTFYCR